MPFRPGQSGNPGGRAKVKTDAARALARRIQEETRDGDELVEFVLGLYRYNDINAGTFHAVHGVCTVTLEDKKWAHAWLSDRGYGRPLQTIDLTGDGEPLPAIRIPVDMTPADLDAAERALLAALGDGDDG